GSDAQGSERTALYWSIRQPGIPECECHVFDGQTKTVGGNLCHDRVGAGSDVLGCACNCEAGVVVEHGFCACLQLCGVPGPAPPAPPDEIVTVSPRPGFRVAARP